MFHDVVTCLVENPHSTCLTCNLIPLVLTVARLINKIQCTVNIHLCPYAQATPSNEDPLGPAAPKIDVAALKQRTAAEAKSNDSMAEDEFFGDEM